jgi:hypothetical protein
VLSGLSQRGGFSLELQVIWRVSDDLAGWPVADTMHLAVIILFALACSTALSILAFMTGRCARKLPVDGMLPRVVHSARFSPEKDGPRPASQPARPTWPSDD